MLGLNKLEIFSIVVQEGSFSGAANRMYMTQSAVSQHIQDLEAALGTKLFKRGRRGVTLTQSGETLYDYTQRILHLVAEAENAVMDVEHISSGQIKLGATPGISVYLLPDWIQAFGRRYPNLTISLNSSVTKDIVTQVLHHKLDVGIVEGEIEQHPENLGILELRKMHLYVIVGQGHRWWNRETVAIEDLAAQPFISRQQNSQTRIWMDRVLSQYGVTPRIVAELDNPESIKQAVLSGMGISILPKCAVYNQEAMNLLRALPLQDVPLHRTMKLLWDRSTPFSPITRAFLTNLTGEFPQLERILSIS